MARQGHRYARTTFLFRNAAAAAEVTLELDQAAETDTALTLVNTKTLELGQAEDASSGHALSTVIGVELGQAVETDTAHTATAGEEGALGLATETDTAFATGSLVGIELGQAIEVDSGLSLVGVTPPPEVPPPTRPGALGRRGPYRVARRATVDDEEVLVLL